MNQGSTKLELLKLEATEDTPQVILDPANKKFQISGRSLPEDPTEFYDPIIEWLDEYCTNPNPKTNFDFKLEYFNTASSKQIYKIFLRLKNLIDNNHELNICWYYQDGDTSIQQAGERYMRVVGVQIQLAKY